MLRTIVAIFVILHGLVHAILAAVPSPKAPDQGAAMFFSGGGAWLLPGLSKSAGQTITIALATIATIGFVATGLALFGIIVPFGAWRALAIGSSVVSLLLLVAFWDKTFIVGLLIDVVLLVLLLFTDWSL
jgi:hypothetical protein